jgi:hypothetical protein
VLHQIRAPQQLEGGDDLVHGEKAYMLGPCEAHAQLEGSRVSLGGSGSGNRSGNGLRML